MVAWSHGRVFDLLPSGLTPFQVGRPCHVIGPIDLPTWNGAYRRLRPCTGSTAAVSTAAGRGLFRPIGTELPPVGNRITTSRQLTLPRRSYYVAVSSNASMRLEQNQRPVRPVPSRLPGFRSRSMCLATWNGLRGTSVDRAAFR